MTHDAYERALQEYLARPVNRRGFLGRTARTLGGLALAGPLATACGGPEAGTDTGGGTVRISNWPLYIAAGTTAGFEAATGIRVAYTEDVNDNNEYYAKVAEPLARGQSIDRDVVILTDWLVARMIRLGYFAPLDDDAFPNKTALLDEFRQVDFDAERRFSVPWLSGMVGLAYNPERTGRDLTSVADIFDPALKGQVTMLTEMRDTVGLLMLAEGKEPERATRADVEAACATVKRYRENGQIRAFTGNDYAADLAAGNIAAAIAWSGDIQGLVADNPDLRWIAPDEGAMRFTDNMCVPVTSDRRALAMAWMNHVYQPRVSAEIIEATLYRSPVEGTLAELARSAPGLADSPLINPPESLRSRLHDFRTLDDDEEQMFNRLFQDAMGA